MSRKIVPTRWGQARTKIHPHLWGRVFLPLGSLLFFLIGLSHPGRASHSFQIEKSAARFERIGPTGGDVRSLVLDPLNPEVAYLGAPDGEIYRSEDGGQSWALQYPGIGHRQFVVDTLIHHPTESNHILAGAWDIKSSGGGLFESRDGGKNWREVVLPDPAPAVRDFAFSRSQPDFMIVGALNAVYVTADGGKKWTTVGLKNPGFHEVESVAIGSRDPLVLYVGTWRLAYRSLDFGKTWHRVDKGMIEDSDVFSLLVDPGNPEVVFAGACTGIYRSANGAGSWERLKVLPDRYVIRTRVVVLDPVNPHRVYGGTTEGLHVSDDEGKTWRRLTPPNIVINAIQIDPRNNRRILLGTEDRGLWSSDDGGKTWNGSNHGIFQRQVWFLVGDSRDAGPVFAGIHSDGLEGGVFRWTNSSNWSPITSELVRTGAEIISFLILPQSKQRLAGTSQGIFRQEGAEDIWEKLSGPIASEVIRAMYFEPATARLCAATDHGLFVAQISDLHFTKSTTETYFPQVFAMVGATGEPGDVYVGTRTGVYRSPDLGKTWQPLASGLPYKVTIECLAVCPAETGHMFAGTMAGLFETRDSGQHWQAVGDGRLSVRIPSVLILDDQGEQVVAADGIFGGVYLSKDAGKSWNRIADPRFSSPVRALAKAPGDPNSVLLGTNTEGVYRLRLPLPF